MQKEEKCLEEQREVMCQGEGAVSPEETYKGRGWLCGGGILTLGRGVSWERRHLGNFRSFHLSQTLAFHNKQVFSRGRRLVFQ